MMPPKRASTRASAAPTPARISSRSTRSRATPFIEGPTPHTAQRGYLANSYGDEDRQPVPSGVADINAAKGFAAEMQAKVNHAHELRAARASRALSKSIEKSRSPSVQRTPETRRSQSQKEGSEGNSEMRSSPSRISEKSRRSRIGSISTTRSVDDDEEVEETLPSGGLGSFIRQFDDSHEGGLEILTRGPGFRKITESLGPIAKDMFWATIYTLPVVFLLWAGTSFGPMVWAYVISSLYALKDVIHVPNFSAPNISFNWPSLKSNHTTTITVALPSQTATETATIYKYRGSDSKAMDELNRMKTDMRSMREHMALLESQIKAPHRVNLFSPNLGAYISQRYTSPTRKQGTSFWTRSYFTIFQEFVPPPPIAALKPWTENGDCWCAAPAPGGKLSLGINLGRDVYPEDFIVEHISKSDALDITSAPKRLDLWTKLAPGFTLENVPNEWRENSKGCESPQPQEKGETWVCMGMTVYDISNEVSAQGRSLTGYHQKPPFKINKAVVRVLENNGKEYTCIYRVKLAGRTDLEENVNYK
jgi:hypothetical protein